MSLVLVLLLLCKYINSQPYNLTANKYVSYYHSNNCPRTSWCLQLNSEAQLLGKYTWPKQLWNGNFTISFWYNTLLNNQYKYKNKYKSTSSTRHNIISNCLSNGLARNTTSFLLATEVTAESTKTSYLDVYFNNSQQCKTIDNTNNSSCFTNDPLINSLWQFITIIYNEKTGFYVYSNTLLIGNITWNNTKHNRNPIESNNVLCIGDGFNNNDGFIQLLTDIRFYNKSIDKKTMVHLHDLNYNLTRNDNDGVFVYYDFINNSTANNIQHLCLQSFYITHISPKAISLNGGNIIHLYGNFGNDINKNNIHIVLYNKYTKWKLNIPSIDISIAQTNQISFSIEQALNGICSDKIYINITSTATNCIINHKNVSIATYSPTIKIFPDQLPAINNFNATIQSECLPPNDNKLHCYIHLNNAKRDVIGKITSTAIICSFPDLSSLLSSTQYNFQIYSLTYNYTTSSTKVTIYNAPSIKSLSSNSFSDNIQSSILLVSGNNFIESQPFDCNVIDPRYPNKLIYQTKGEISGTNSVSCLVSTNLISPYSNYKFYLSSENYFNSSKIPIIIYNSPPHIPNTIFIWNGNGNNRVYPSSSLQYFYTQFVDKSYNNFTLSPKGYEMQMISNNCPALQMVSNDLQNGKFNWSYVAPPAFNSNNFSCLINFTVFDFNDHTITSYMLFTLQFMTIKPVIKSINNTLFQRNNITNFMFEMKSLYIDNNNNYYYKYNNSKTYILSNDMSSIKCVFTNANDKNTTFESVAILLKDDKHNNIQSLQCPNVIISEIGQYIFQFKMVQFKQIFYTQPFNKPNSIIFTYNLPTFNKINLNNTKHIYLYGNNLNIGQNSLHICQWNVQCNFGPILFSDGYVINQTTIFCSMPDIDHGNLDNVLPITITYYEYIDSNNNIYNTFNSILLLTNLSLSFITSCPGNNCNGNGYCDYDAICHCDIGYSGNDCSLPLYYIIITIVIIIFMSIIIILLYCCRKYQTKYNKLKKRTREYQQKEFRNNKGKLKYYGYKPIDDDDNLCCCFNLTPEHYGYYICCQFCCFCDEKINQIKLPDDESNTYTSTFHQQKLTAAGKYTQQNSNLYNNNNNNNNNHNSDSESEQELSVDDQQLSIPKQYR